MSRRNGTGSPTPSPQRCTICNVRLPNNKKIIKRINEQQGGVCDFCFRAGAHERDHWRGISGTENSAIRYENGPAPWMG